MKGGKREGETCSPLGEHLLDRLDCIFEWDPLIDEVGFVHPSQLSSLQLEGNCPADDAALALSPLSGELPHNENGARDDLVVYCGNHKLAIAFPALRALYRAARSIFASASDQYRSCSRVYGTRVSTVEASKLEDTLLSCSRALVIVNCDHASAWNIRKRIFSGRPVTSDAMTAELRLSSVVLCCRPKSEETWSHRRWAIKMLFAHGTGSTNMDKIVEDESLLVELFAERSHMNYRAWRHRYWLVSFMSLSQIILELKRTKPWAQVHVSDNSCFHYRRCLLRRLLEGSPPDVQGMDDFSAASILDTAPALSWKEELLWNRELICRFIGHEALWVHRRFLVGSWPWQATTDQDGHGHISPVSSEENQSSVPTISVKGELTMADLCISSCTTSSPEDLRQREFAATYKLWLVAQGKKESSGFDTTGLDLDSIGSLLREASGHRQRLWDGLVPNLLRPMGSNNSGLNVASGYSNNSTLS